jgi:hypothetical protein
MSTKEKEIHTVLCHSGRGGHQHTGDRYLIDYMMCISLIRYYRVGRAGRERQTGEEKRRG